MRFLVVYAVTGYWLIFGQPSAYAQNKKIDSLKKEFNTAKHDTTKAIALVKLSDAFFMLKPDTVISLCLGAVKIADARLENCGSIEKRRYLITKASAFNNIGGIYDQQSSFTLSLNYFSKSLKIWEELGDKTGTAHALNNIGLVYFNKGDIQGALGRWNRSLSIAEEIGNKKGVAITLNNLGGLYNSLGDIPKALDYWTRSLKIMEEFGHRTGMSHAVNNIGSIYLIQGQLQKALDYFGRSLKLCQESGDKHGIANALNNLGATYKKQGNSALALQYWHKGLRIQEEMGYRTGIASTLHNIGTIHKKNGEFTQALDYFSRSLKIRKEIGDKSGTASSQSLMGDLYFRMAAAEKEKSVSAKHSRVAAGYIDSSLALSKKLGFPELIQVAELIYARIDSMRGNAKGAFLHYKQYILYRDSISNQQTRKASIKNQMKYEFDKKEAVIKEQQLKEREVAGEKSRKQKIIIWLVAGGLVLVLGFAAFIFRTLKTTRLQKDIIEEKQKEILDSIRYAKKIQYSLLPPEKYITRIFNRLKKN